MPLNKEQAIAAAPEGMKEWLQTITSYVRFKRFEADDLWTRQKGRMYIINCDLTDIDKVSKKTGIAKKTLGNRKVLDVNLKTLLGHKIKDKVWNVRFRETRKKTGKADAKTTAMQEAGSRYVFEYALNNKKSGWATEKKFETDVEMIEGLRKIYPDVDSEWLSVFWKQHKVIIKKFGNSKINRFDHEGGFMKEIKTIVNKKFNITRKDNWNPADIWGVRGNSDEVIRKVKEATEGSPESQTIQQLNTLLRSMYKAKELIGISLKKTSGPTAQWEEYNIEKMTLDEVDEYKYKKIELTCNIQIGSPDPIGKPWTQDSKVRLRQSRGGPEYDFQIKQNSTGDFSNLKFESTPIGGRAARGGKAEVKAVEALLKFHGESLTNAHQKYPMNFDQFMTQTIDGRSLSHWKTMFNNVNKKAETGCKNEDQFVDRIGKVFLSEKPYEANSKLMQLHFLDDVIHLQRDNQKYTEFWTDMLFLSIKKGDRFGPFGKLY